MNTPADRKLRGAWYTPDALVDAVVGNVVDERFARHRAGRRVRVLDPACGDGRFLLAAHRVLADLGVDATLHGVEIDPAAAADARARLRDTEAQVDIVAGDALTLDWSAAERFDLVVGNPPFLSQMAATTSRGGASRRGGGPYADVAVEFLALAREVVDPDGGRVGLVLPQAVVASRDADDVRVTYDAAAEMIWSWWTPERVFDAQVIVCAVGFEFGRSPRGDRRHGDWSHVVTEPVGVPTLPNTLTSSGTLGDRARLNANFRDEYYGMRPAVGDHRSGPRLITSGLIDPGCSLWGRRPVTFARHRYDRPRIDLERLDDKMRRWAADRLVPKVLVANQTSVIEAVADPDGETLPGVPVVAIYPDDDGRAAVWEIAAVLTSPLASAWAWHRSAGSGLSATSIRVGPVVLADLPWPAGPLDEAVAALRSGDVRGCGAAVDAAYGVDDADLAAWWAGLIDRIESRRR